MSKSQRDKGAVYEREVCHSLDLLQINAERSARNGVRGATDIIGWSGVHLEAKRRASIAACRYLDQAIADAPKGTIPAVAMREDRGDSVLMIRLCDLVELCGAVATAHGTPIYPKERSV